MFLVPLKHTLTEAWKRTFDGEYPEEDFRELAVGIEWPVERQDYPHMWIDFDQVGDLEPMGIGHIEVEEGEEGARIFTRWKYQGTATFTLVALTSAERDRLFDEVVRVLAFGRESAQTSEFRAFIESNQWLIVNFDWDQIGVGGKGETPGTPWGSDEVIYEISVSVECFGEFFSDKQTATLVKLTDIQTFPYRADEEEPDSGAGGAWQ